MKVSEELSSKLNISVDYLLSVGRTAKKLLGFESRDNRVYSGSSGLYNNINPKKIHNLISNQNFRVYQDLLEQYLTNAKLTLISGEGSWTNSLGILSCLNDGGCSSFNNNLVLYESNFIYLSLMPQQILEKTFEKIDNIIYVITHWHNDHISGANNIGSFKSKLINLNKTPEFHTVTIPSVEQFLDKFLHQNIHLLRDKKGELIEQEVTGLIFKPYDNSQHGGPGKPIAVGVENELYLTDYCFTRIAENKLVLREDIVNEQYEVVRTTTGQSFPSSISDLKRHGSILNNLLLKELLNPRIIISNQVGAGSLVPLELVIKEQDKRFAEDTKELIIDKDYLLVSELGNHLIQESVKNSNYYSGTAPLIITDDCQVIYPEHLINYFKSLALKNQ